MTIGIIGAMEQEVAVLREQLINPQTITVAGCEFYQGTLAGKKVVITRSGIGKVAVSIATTLLLERFSPSAVINTGSAGGFDPELSVGDVVISSEVRFHDVDVTAFGYEIGQMAQQPAAFVADTQLITLAQDCLAEQNEINSAVGLICTGDQFMHRDDQLQKAITQFPTMKACEMEAGAVGQVCHQFQVPFVVVRALSDIAGKEQVESFEAFLEVAAQHSSAMVLAMIARMPN
ncbi:5'-methylthioadenosine/S-adenosylhomocysteine nucleosidase [Oceanisphaera pacifica]|uniref:5'-methylthioadenosine/S-adenosylhomocysteine nucleosidase n=1 Tax=Oceanisphaera pacifica TaxID=2818389 RepID=A0ABS3NIE5_9GAMM|nr:5'-methylthioadenosine/S-adenosylhomocysteine nucleosidase [Oceanisphaera pacifica]MBO1520358.1 5'-methylthioadenosine/S-adenosylhomocysteine nucleosidase [Oceanisphaera pacifica]